MLMSCAHARGAQDEPTIATPIATPSKHFARRSPALLVVDKELVVAAESPEETELLKVANETLSLTGYTPVERKVSGVGKGYKGGASRIFLKFAGIFMMAGELPEDTSRSDSDYRAHGKMMEVVDEQFDVLAEGDGKIDGVVSKRVRAACPPNRCRAWP